MKSMVKKNIVTSKITAEGIEDINEVCHEAVQAVNMFDQANTGGAIVNLGHRGFLLARAINDLRAALNMDRQRTCLTEEQAR